MLSLQARGPWPFLRPCPSGWIVGARLPSLCGKGLGRQSEPQSPREGSGCWASSPRPGPQGPGKARHTASSLSLVVWAKHCPLWPLAGGGNWHFLLPQGPWLSGVLLWSLTLRRGHPFPSGLQRPSGSRSPHVPLSSVTAAGPLFWPQGVRSLRKSPRAALCL